MTALLLLMMIVIFTLVREGIPSALFAHASNGQTTAWSQGNFVVDPANVVERSNIVLGSPNTAANQSMPLGNGRLGAAVWAASGFTAQLNRVDTFPDRKSPGQIVIPGLARLTGASNYKGTVNLYDAMFTESGGGMTANTYILQNKDELIVDVTGADPSSTQTAQVHLWSGRSPTAAAQGTLATLAETWKDNSGNGASGNTFGSLAGITAGGRNVTAKVVNSTTVQVSFQPNADGSFRVVVAAPHWTGGNALTTATSLIGGDATASTGSLQSKHLSWWHTYWGSIGLIEMNSSDGSAQYIENIRDINLYTAAAYSQGQLPGSHAGVADLFNWDQDFQRWFASGYWHWNLRMQVAANMGAGAFALNTPYFNLYTGNLANIETWTKAQMGGKAGACVPETMRFNGNGNYIPPRDVSNASCDANIAATFNARTLSTGAEVGLWIWQQYLYTGDTNFLSANYPLMAAAAQFLLAYATQGSDGKLHTSPSNAHETQWDVNDPTTDIAAMQALFPAVIHAATLLNRDATLVAQLKSAEAKILPFARTDESTLTKLLSPSADASGTDVIAPSYAPAATKHNVENVGLEPVWPYGLVGDNSGSLTSLAIRTFDHRPHSVTNDWSNDPIQAARLGLAGDFQSTVVSLTKKYQIYPSGMADLGGKTSSNQPYAEEAGVAATAVQEALVQDYDGLLRIAPAWPSNWDVSGTVFIHGNSKVDVQVEGGKLTTVVIEAGSTQTITIRNPWQGQQVQVIDGAGNVVVAATSSGQFPIPATAGHAYLIEQVASPTTALPFAVITGKAATADKSLGSRTIGLP
jgi:alpha-L-fucosidase 2